MDSLAALLIPVALLIGLAVGWLLKGKLKSKEHIVEGLESFPESLAKLFSGENHGKLVLKV